MTKKKEHLKDSTSTQLLVNGNLQACAYLLATLAQIEL